MHAECVTYSTFFYFLNALLTWKSVLPHSGCDGMEPKDLMMCPRLSAVSLDPSLVSSVCVVVVVSAFGEDAPVHTEPGGSRHHGNAIPDFLSFTLLPHIEDKGIELHRIT